jgi:hypothetical protein
VRGRGNRTSRNVDADIPRDALVVFTGVSGSGKSSLAFGTLYAEAQRRYLESVAPYARRLFYEGLPRKWPRCAEPAARLGTTSNQHSVFRTSKRRAAHPGAPPLPSIQPHRVQWT